MKRIFKFLMLILGLPVVVSCNLDENKRLQINQAFEGEEIYLNSKILDETLHLAFYDLKTFQDTLFTDSLAGCPMVIVDTLAQETVLNYGEKLCLQENRIPRSGKVTIRFIEDEESQSDSIHVQFDQYELGNLTLQGERKFVLSATSLTRKTYLEVSENLMIMDENESSSRINLDFSHELRYRTKSLLSIQTSGGLTSRNWSGNEASMLISRPKSLSSDCIGINVFRPVAGEENWTIYRTAGNPVTHQLVYESDGNCMTTTKIFLSEGVQIEKSP